MTDKNGRPLKVGDKWRKAKGRIMLWRGLFFFTPDEGQSPQ